MKKFAWLERLMERLNKSKNNAGAQGTGSHEAESSGDSEHLHHQNLDEFQSSSSRAGTLKDILLSNQNVSVQKIVRSVKKPPLEDYYPYILGIWLGFAGADLTTTAIRPMLTSPPPSVGSATKSQLIDIEKSLSDYEMIVNRNIFDSEGKIPDALNQAEEKKEDFNTDGPASLSRLPMKLLGTIVHFNAAKSVASIEVRAGQTKSLPYIPNDNIEGIATLIKVERQKAFIRNLSNKKLEYVEMEIEGSLSFGKTPGQDGESVADGIKKDGNQFQISKVELTKQLKNLPELLKQARAVPHRDPYTGQMTGFKILDIKQGSIIGKLVESGDVIEEVNGVKINSAARAMEMYRTLKDSSDVKITVERNGRKELLDFSVK